MAERQSQSVTDSSTAYQAGRDLVVQVGVSASEARQIALDVFHANLMEFKAEAGEIARERGEQITAAFLDKLQRENPVGLNQARDPDFQDALFSVQKEHAKAGDEELGELLVDLLVDRTKQDSRTVLQLVLNEALRTAPKLTSAQTATLAVIFFLRYVRRTRNLANLAQLGEYLQGSLLQASSGFSGSVSTFNHLTFAGCGADLPFIHPLQDVFLGAYPGLFTVGFDQQAIDAAQMSDNAKAVLLMPCIDDVTRFQINALNDDDVEGKCQLLGLSPEEKGRVLALSKGHPMPHDRVQAKVVEVAPFMEPIFAAWSADDGKLHSLGRYQLTSVGMAIAHASIKRHIGEFAALSIWIN